MNNTFRTSVERIDARWPDHALIARIQNLEARAIDPVAEILVVVAPPADLREGGLETPHHVTTTALPADLSAAGQMVNARSGAKGHSDHIAAGQMVNARSGARGPAGLHLHGLAVMRGEMHQGRPEDPSNVVGMN
ncbi:MAG: hypothetical protein ACKO85_20815 [Isosphaeraceae bacterium]